MTDALAKRFSPVHLTVLMQTKYEDQGAYSAISARDWASDILRERRPWLPSTPSTRENLRAYCTSDADVLDCYLAVMAWGRQDARPGGRKQARYTWCEHKELIRDRLETLRSKQSNRTEAFGLFSGDNWVPGLGVAFFTKLLYFFAPQSTAGADRYILDRWTAISVNLLAGRRVINLSPANAKDKPPNYVTRLNTPAIYEAYCTELEALAVILNHRHSDAPLRVEDIELMLFSSAGSGQWRQYVLRKWKECAPALPFSKNKVLDRACSLRTLLNSEPPLASVSSE